MIKYPFGFGSQLNAQDVTKNEETAVKEYKYKGEIFYLDDSNDCSVGVTYKDLKGVVRVNMGNNRSEQSPYSWNIDGSDKSGFSSPEEARDSLCDRLLSNFRAAEAAAAFDPKLYCEALHDSVKNLP